MECLEWAYAFKEAPDLEAAGAAIARSLVKAVVCEPLDRLQPPGRLILEDSATDIIRRSRERDFAWVAKLPTFADILKTFTAQNAALESRTRRGSSWQIGSTHSKLPSGSAIVCWVTSTMRMPMTAMVAKG